MSNVLTNVGRTITAGRLLPNPPNSPNAGSAAPQYIAWGTGSPTSPATDVAATDTALFAESTEARSTGTCTLQQTAVGLPAGVYDTFQAVGTLTATSTRVITEAGVLDAAKGQGGSPTGNLFVHSLFSTINLGTNDQITFTFRVQFA